MIKFIENEFKICNSCLISKEDIKTLIFKPDNSCGGTSIMLCKECREKLKKLLENEKN